MKPGIIERAPGKLSGLTLVECPKCAGQLPFSRKPVPAIDGSGFESYSLECAHCGAELVGIIDPFDDHLLVSELER